jgi:hypothetical protein
MWRCGGVALFLMWDCPDNPSSASDVIEGRLVEIGLRVLELGGDVVIDFGLWGRDERSALRRAAADRVAAVEVRYLELPPDEQWRRIHRRQAQEPHTTWPMPDAEVAAWTAGFDVPTAGEVDGTEPIDSPPNGFASWDACARTAGRRPSSEVRLAHVGRASKPRPVAPSLGG